MPYRSLLYRTLALATGLLVLGVSAVVALSTHEEPAPPPPARETRAVTDVQPATPTRADSLALAFRRLQRTFLRDSADLPSEAPLNEVVRLLHARADFVEVTWVEETLLLAESRLHHLQSMLDLWGIYEDHVALRSEAGEPTVRVDVYEPGTSADTLGLAEPMLPL